MSTKYENLVGKTIQIINMEGEPQYTNTVGVVEYVDDMNQIHGTWGGCALCPDYGDKFIIIK